MFEKRVTEGQTDAPTDRPTDQWTDQGSYRGVFCNYWMGDGLIFIMKPNLVRVNMNRYVNALVHTRTHRGVREGGVTGVTVTPLASDSKWCRTVNL